MTKTLFYGTQKVEFNLDECRVDSLAKMMVVSFAEQRGGEGTLPTEDDRAAAVANLRDVDVDAAELAASLDIKQFRFV